MSIPETDNRHISAAQLMQAQMKAEFDLAHDKLYLSRHSLYALLNALSGVASNGTCCGACRMSAGIAHNALDVFEHATGISREMAYRGSAR